MNLQDILVGQVVHLLESDAVWLVKCKCLITENWVSVCIISIKNKNARLTLRWTPSDTQMEKCNEDYNSDKMNLCFNDHCSELWFDYLY